MTDYHPGELVYYWRQQDSSKNRQGPGSKRGYFMGPARQRVCWQLKIGILMGHAVSWQLKIGILMGHSGQGQTSGACEVGS